MSIYVAQGQNRLTRPVDESFLPNRPGAPDYSGKTDTGLDSAALVPGVSGQGKTRRQRSQELTPGQGDVHVPLATLCGR